MINYSILDLENLTGIKAHTIRIWEKRYGILDPDRTNTNIRLYSNEELRKLINVSILYHNGMKISHVANLNETELNLKLNELNDQTESDHAHMFDLYVGNMINAGLTFDEISFDRNFNNAILKFGLHSTYVNVLMPMLHRIGLLYNTGNINPAQEHFLSNLVMQKLHSAIDGLQPSSQSEEKWLLFLPQHEDHEISLLMANYLLRSSGKNVIYLGSRVPFDALTEAAENCKPTHLMFVITRNQGADELNQYFEKMADQFSQKKIIVAGSSSILDRFTIKKPITWIKNLNEFVNKL